MSVLGGRGMGLTPASAPPGDEVPSDALTVIAVTTAPVVLEGRYRLLIGTLWQLRHSRRGRWALAGAQGVCVLVVAGLAARHFATTKWPLSGGDPGWLVAAGLLLLLAQALKAFGWARVFAAEGGPRTTPPPGAE